MITRTALGDRFCIWAEPNRYPFNYQDHPVVVGSSYFVNCTGLETMHLRTVGGISLKLVLYNTGP